MDAATAAAGGILLSIAVTGTWFDIRYRRLPNWLCGAAFVAGVLAARFLKSSSTGLERTEFSGQAGQLGACHDHRHKRVKGNEEGKQHRPDEFPQALRHFHPVVP